MTTLHNDGSAMDAYAAVSEEWVDPDLQGLADVVRSNSHGDPVTVRDIIGEGPRVLDNPKVARLIAVDGPFDGVEIVAPADGEQVILNAAFGKATDLLGPVIYKRVGNFMVFLGQPDQTDEAHTDEDEDDGPKQLILP